MSSRAASLRPPAAPEPREQRTRRPPLPDRPIAPLPHHGRPRRDRVRAVLGCAALVLLVAGAAGAVAKLLRTDSPRTAQPAAERLVRLGAASVTVPSEWSPVRAADAGMPDLEGQTAVFAPVPGLSANAVVVLAPDRLPGPLLDMIGPPHRSRRTTLAGQPARAYEPRPVGRDRIAALTVSTTPSGILAVACIARTASWSGASGCAAQVAAAR